MPTGPGDTGKQLGMMQDMRTTVLAATSSCALPPVLTAFPNSVISSSGSP